MQKTKCHRVCAWCKVPLGGDFETEWQGTTTKEAHGICPECAVIVEKDFDKALEEAVVKE